MTTSSSLASAPVWAAVARAPASVDPALKTTRCLPISRSALEPGDEAVDIADRLAEQRDHARGLVLGEPGEDVGERQVRFVARAQQQRDPEARVLGALHEQPATAAGLGEHRDPAGFSDSRKADAERGDTGAIGDVQESGRVRADDPDAGLARDLGETLLLGAALLADLAEAGGEHERAAEPRVRALLHRVEDPGRPRAR